MTPSLTSVLVCSPDPRHSVCPPPQHHLVCTDPPLWWSRWCWWTRRSRGTPQWSPLPRTPALSTRWWMCAACFLDFQCHHHCQGRLQLFWWRMSWSEEHILSVLSCMRERSLHWWSWSHWSSDTDHCTATWGHTSHHWLWSQVEMCWQSPTDQCSATVFLTLLVFLSLPSTPVSGYRAVWWWWCCQWCCGQTPGPALSPPVSTPLWSVTWSQEPFLRLSNWKAAESG